MNIPNGSGISSSSALSTLKTHRKALEGLLPSQETTQLHRKLGPRLRDIARVMTSPYAALDPALPRERDFQRLLWLQANTSGLIVLLLSATARTVTLDAEGSTAVTLVTCINLILASGIQNRRFSPRHGMEDVEIIKRVAAVAVPTIKTSWTKLIESVHSIRPLLLKSIDRIEVLVEFACNATEFVEGVRSEESTGTEVTGAIDTFQSSMCQSAALEELLLHFISLKENSLQSPLLLVGRAIATFTSVFEGHRPPLAAPPQDIHNLAVVFERLLNPTGWLGAAAVDVAHYSSIVKMISLLLARPEFGQCFRDDIWKNEGSVQVSRRGKEQLCWAICSVYRRWLRDEKTQKATSIDTMKVTINALIVACHLASLESDMPSRSDLFLHNLVPLLARAVLSWRLLGDNALGDAKTLEGYNWQSSVRRNLFLVFPGRIRLLEPLIDRSVGFLEVIDALRTAKSLNPDITTDIPMGIWKDFCALGNMDEQEHRKREINHRKKQMGDQVGCRWTKCPMYGTEGLERRQLLVCARCRTAVYCGTFCQARDWDEQHQLVCQL